MLAADYLTLPEPMRTAVIAFFERNEEWLTAVLEQGSGDGSLRVTEDPSGTASTLIGAIEAQCSSHEPSTMSSGSNAPPTASSSPSRASVERVTSA